jgi:hypothetical protein
VKKVLKVGAVIVGAAFILILVLGYLSLDDDASQQSNASDRSSKSNSLSQTKTFPKVVLSCRSTRSGSSESIIVALFNAEADVIFFGQNGIWTDGSGLKLPLEATDFSYKVAHPYFNNKFSINRTSLELVISTRTKSIFTGEDNSIFNKYPCMVDSTDTYTKALEKYTSYVESLRLKEHKELDDLKANRKI